MTNEPQTRQIDKSAARVFWNRASQCATVMNEVLERGQWEAAGVNAVHAAISANDAVLAGRRGVKSVSPDHKDTVRVLLAQFKDKDGRKAAKRLGTILARKSRVEYEEKRFTEREARELVLDTSRFLEWAKSVLPKEFQ